jgi:hypothetical protein
LTWTTWHDKHVKWRRIFEADRGRDLHSPVCEDRAWTCPDEMHARFGDACQHLPRTDQI